MLDRLAKQCGSKKERRGERGGRKRLEVRALEERVRVRESEGETERACEREREGGRVSVSGRECERERGVVD